MTKISINVVLLAALAACGGEAGDIDTVGTVEQALVTLDRATGTGFVGKGDVQLAFGWNNAALQKNAAGVTFTYASTEEYEATCTWMTGEGKKGEKIHNVTHDRTASISGAIAYDARVRNQITGFNLIGFAGAPSVTGEAPVIGGACPGNQGTGGTWTAVTLLDASSGLYANFAGASVLLPEPPSEPVL